MRTVAKGESYMNALLQRNAVFSCATATRILFHFQMSIFLSGTCQIQYKPFYLVYLVYDRK